MGQSAPGAGDAAPEVHLAAFGKHPGWNDHIDDLGLETDRLVAVKRILYLEGIGAAIDSGAWDKLHESQRVEGFGHILVWRTAGDVIVARMWSSSDGKGRTKYPMIVCAQLRGVPLQPALDRVLPVLEGVQKACQETASADAVRGILSSGRTQLRNLLAALPADEPELVVPASAIGALAADPAFGEGGGGEGGGGGGREGLLRILYQVEREMAPYLSIGAGGKSRLGTPVGGGKSRMVDLRPQQIRVPACGGAPGEVILKWTRFLLAMLDPATSIVVIAPIGQPWADLIVGEPAGSQFFCIRASPKSLPLTSDIPYTLDPAFLAGAQRLLDAPLAGGDIVIRRSAGSGGAPLAGVASKLGWSRHAKLLAIGIGGVVLVGGTVWALRPSSPAAVAAKSPTPAAAGAREGARKASSGPEQKAAPAPDPATPGEGSGEGAFDEGPWQELCSAYQDWAGQFLRKLDGERRTRLGADPDLAKMLACFGAPGAKNDPWSIAEVERGPLAPLIRQVPAAVQTAAGKARTAEALACMKAVSATLSPEGWTRLAQLQSAGERFRERGWTAGHEVVAEAVRGVSPARGVDVAEAIDAVLAVAEAVESVERRWSAIEGAAGTLAKTDDPVLRAFNAWAEGVGVAVNKGEDGVAVIREIERRLAEAEAVGTELAGFVGSDNWTYVDHEAFRRASRAHQAVGAGRTADAGLFRDWLFEAPSYPAPDRDADPRRRWVEVAGGARQPASLAAAAGLAERLRGELADQARAAEAQDTEHLAGLESLQRRAAELGGMRWSAAERGRIETESSRIAAEADELKRLLESRVATLAAAAAQSFAEAAEQVRGRDEVTASAALNAAWRAERDAAITEIGSSPSGGEAATLLSRMNLLERAVRDLDRAVPAAELPLGSTGAAWAAAIRAEAAASRETALEGALRDVSAGRPIAERAEAVAREAGERSRRELAVLTALAEKAAALEGMLADAYGLNEGSRQGMGSVADLAVEIREALNLRGSPALSSAMKPLMDRVLQLGAIAASSDRPGLAQQVRAARADAPEQALAAWRRLGELGWPGDLAELDQEQGLRESLGRVAGTLREASRRDAIAAELAAEGLKRFERAAVRLAHGEEMDAAFAFLPGLGLSAESLQEPALRFNALVFALKGDLARGEMTEEGAIARIEQFLRDAAPVASGRGRAEGVVAELRELAGATRKRIEEGDTTPPPDLSKHGPGALGSAWTTEVRHGGAEVVYRHGAGEEQIELRFVRVAVPGGSNGGGGGVAYLQANELSYAQFSRIVATLGEWPDAAQLLRPFTASTDSRQGPRVWMWEENSRGPVLVMRLADSWLRRSAAMATTAYYASDLDAGEPTPDHPMQQIPPDVGMYVAALVGCRLPTSGEWLAAYGESKDLPRERWNLRDAQWGRQRDYVDEVRRTGRLPEWPDGGIFWPARFTTSKRGKAAETHAWDDGTLWFLPASMGALEGTASGATRTAHLVGNVAEYVFDDPAVFAGLAAAEPEAIQTLLGANATRLGVIGGSALSPPELPVETVLPVDLEESLEVGYADVGVRLAFAIDGAGGGGVGLVTAAGSLLRQSGYELAE